MQISDSIRRALSNAATINILTGAGVSTASGIPDFRSADEQWKHALSREEVISLKYFKEEPDAFWNIYRQLFFSKVGAEPNSVHQWISDLQQEKTWARVTTQNVDGLHRAAGSNVVVEIHGNVHRSVCINKSCSAIHNNSYAEGSKAPQCSYCDQPLKPDVVLFGERIKHIQAALNNAEAADVMLVMGTSLRVTPFNQFPRHAEWVNPRQIQIYVGQEEPPKALNFRHVVIGDLTEFVESLPMESLN